MALCSFSCSEEVTLQCSEPSGGVIQTFSKEDGLAVPCKPKSNLQKFKGTVFQWNTQYFALQGLHPACKTLSGVME